MAACRRRHPTPQRECGLNRRRRCRPPLSSYRQQAQRRPPSASPHRNDQTLDTAWQGALAAAERTENEVGTENLGPWDDFEWGMINGKLSALRWGARQRMGHARHLNCNFFGYLFAFVETQVISPAAVGYAKVGRTKPIFTAEFTAQSTIEPSLPPASPKNGNIRGISQRLSPN
jgi:hypothetical protein